MLERQTSGAENGHEAEETQEQTLGMNCLNDYEGSTTAVEKEKALGRSSHQYGMRRVL